VCFGLSGAITRVWKGEQTRIVTGLPSHASPEGFGATGPHDLALRGNNTAFVVTGLAGDPAFREAFGQDAADFGKLLRVRLNKGNWESVADLVDYEADTDPDEGGVDSNPYAVISAGDRHIVVDAGSNDLLRVGENGRVSTLAVFPERMVDAPDFLGLPPGTQIPMESVPTTVVQRREFREHDHDDDDESGSVFYVGELTGFPFQVGGARIYRVVPGKEPQVFAEGFTGIIDMAFSPKDGRLYVLEFQTNGLLTTDLTGALIRVNRDGSQEVIASDGLVAPGGLAFGPDGAAYVTNFGIFPGEGQVVRIPIGHKDDD
jgi:DNA-binding beta-propeller fold protein YncE